MNNSFAHKPIIGFTQSPAQCILKDKTEILFGICSCWRKIHDISILRSIIDMLYIRFDKNHTYANHYCDHDFECTP